MPISLFGPTASDEFEVGSPDYIMSPRQKALWRCSYKFEKADLDVIYETALTCEIGFGKSFFVDFQSTRESAVFRCWHPKDTEAWIQQSLGSASALTQASRHWQIGHLAFTVLQMDKSKVRVVPLVAIRLSAYRKISANGGFENFLMSEQIYSQGPTYAESDRARTF